MAVKYISNKEELVEIVLPFLSDYQPAPKVTAQTLHDDLTTVSGPAGVGKNTVMSKTGIWTVVSDTTREKQFRDGKWEIDGVDYHFLGEKLTKMYQDITSGKYVQIEPVDVGEKGVDLYGSHHKAYPEDGPVLIDVVIGAVEKIRNLKSNFLSINSVYIVAQNYKSYFSRLQSRGDLPKEELLKRLNEGYDSLTQGLEDEDMVFILNKHQEAASRELTKFAEKREYDHSLERIARNAGYNVLKGLTKELAKSQNFYLR